MLLKYVVDHISLAAAQENCPDVTAHRAGFHPAGLEMKDHEFEPGVTLYCDVSNGLKARPLVPQSWRNAIIRLFHEVHHPGKAETIRKVAARYYWPTMRKDVTKFVDACHGCQSVKIHKSIAPPTANRPVLQRRFSDLQLDVVGPLPRSHDGMRYILTILDRTTRFLDAVPMPEATSENCCRALIEAWISRFGLPDHATSDNGNTFTANLWSKLHQDWSRIPRYIYPYTP